MIRLVALPLIVFMLYSRISPQLDDNHLVRLKLGCCVHITYCILSGKVLLAFLAILPLQHTVMYERALGTRNVSCYTQEQAEQLTVYLASLPEDERPTAIYSSPYCG